MIIDQITHVIFIWVTRYIACFSLLSIATWAVCSYLWSRKWQGRIRDSGVYLLSIGILTLVLALRPEETNTLLWPPITWFGFTMLLVLEMLWLSFLVEHTIRGARALLNAAAQRVNPPAPQVMRPRQ